MLANLPSSTFTTVDEAGAALGKQATTLHVLILYCLISQSSSFFSSPHSIASAAQMEAWARRYGATAQFLCVCVESERVAVAFSRMFDLQAAINCYIPGRSYMPVGFGQLGCSGFIISDPNGCFVSRKTQAYNDYGEDAFSDVERILGTALNVRPPPSSPSTMDDGTLHPSYPYRVGNRAILEGITNQTSLDGAVVIILGFDSTSQRFHVKLDDGSQKLLAVLPCSLAPYTTVETATPKKRSYSDERETTSSITVPDSVGNSIMDEEHGACTDVLNELLKDPCQEKLEAAIDVLAWHFGHEEDLLKKHGFGGDPSSSFSALASHIKDHTRILDIGRKALNNPSSTTAAKKSKASVEDSC